MNSVFIAFPFMGRIREATIFPGAISPICCMMGAQSPDLFSASNPLTEAERQLVLQTAFGLYYSPGFVEGKMVNLQFKEKKQCHNATSYN
ncbi:MAG: hypothetical protein ACOC1D_01035 [Prolixibacteraceae bacterium]